MLIYTKNIALGEVSRDKYSTRLCLVLYLSLNTPPRAVFSIQIHGSALSNVPIKYAVMNSITGLLLKWWGEAS